MKDEENKLSGDKESGAKKRKLIGKDRFSLRNSPVFAIVVIMLFTLGVVLLPGEKLGALMPGSKGVDARNLGNAIFRLAGLIVIVLLALDLGFDIFGFRGRGKGFLLSLPFIIVAVNNAPIAGFVSGDVSISAGGVSIFLFTLNCICVGLFEETVFRGVVFPLVLKNMKHDKKGMFWSVIISSALFGAVHLVNLLSGNPLAVLAQIGYSFLIGAMCAMVMLMCRNVFACAGLHALYNFGGLIADELGTGQVWNAFNITLTAVVGVLAALYGVFLLLKKADCRVSEKLYDSRHIIESDGEK